MAAGAKNTTQAYRVFIKKYASVPEAESWVSLARKSIKGLAPKTHDAHQANVKRIKPAYHKAVIKQAVVYDGRNIYNPEVVRYHGFDYQGIGRGVL